MKYKHVFFDLDHTLWDFETNSKLVLKQLFNNYNLHTIFPDFNSFYNMYEDCNSYLWSQYGKGLLTKEFLRNERFRIPLREKKYPNADILGDKLADDYVELSPFMTNLMPNSLELLNKLSGRADCSLYIITNGFKEIQTIKLKQSGLHNYFKKIFISEVVGYSKPKKEFFKYAISSCNAKKSESIVIGDNLDSDIQGAINFGLDYIYYNPNKIKHDKVLKNEVHDLIDILSIL